MTKTSHPEPSVNTSLFLGGVTGIASYYLYPEAGSVWQQDVIFYGLAGVAGVSALQGIKALAKDIGVKRKLLESEKDSTDYGSAREATEEEIEARGCFKPTGSFIGFKYGRAVFTPPGSPFQLIEAPAGSGKDIYFNTGNVIHHSLLGHSVLASDVKLETAPMLAQGLKDADIEVWGINPTKQYMDLCGNTELGLYQGILDAVYGGEQHQKDAIGIAQQLALLHLPEDKTEGGKQYFVGGTRRALIIPPLLNAVIDPPRCTPSDSYELLNDPEEFIRTLKLIVNELKPFEGNDRIVKFLKSEALNLLDRSKKNPENFGSFLEWATQCLAPYNQAGHLSDYGSTNAVRNISEMTENPITAFPMVPHSHAVELESFISIQNHNLIAARKRNFGSQRIHLQCNEFLNYRFADITSDLEIMRGLNMTADLYIQSFNGLIRKYGKEVAASINDYCDTKVYLGLNSYERAKYVSDMLSEATIESKDYSYKASPDVININSKKHARRLATSDEILSMPRDQAWVCIKGLRPFRVQLKHYGHIAPWKTMTSINPLEGSPLQGETLLEINYPERNRT